MNLEHCHSTLIHAGVAFDPGLTPSEFAAVEDRFRFTFPPDLREFLAFALPRGRGFPNWRAIEDPALAESFRTPLEGICFDIEHNAFWPVEWGEKPGDLRVAFDIAAQEVAKAPRLVPIIGHRYIPDRPSVIDNPIFSVHQTDIIYYGGHLQNYLENEFNYYFGTPEYQLPASIRVIEFWSWLVELNA